MRTTKSFFFSILLHLILVIFIVFSLQKEIIIKPPAPATQTITFNIQHFKESVTFPKSKPKPDAPTLDNQVSPTQQNNTAVKTQTIPKPLEELSEETFDAYTKQLLKSMAALAALENNATKIASRPTPKHFIRAKKKTKKKTKKKKISKKKLRKKIVKKVRKKRVKKRSKKIVKKKKILKKRSTRKKKIVKKQKKRKKRKVKRKTKRIVKQNKSQRKSTQTTAKDSLANHMRGASTARQERGSRRGSRTSGASMHMINKFYGSEFNSFSATQKKFIEKNLGNIYKITQRKLSRNGYPRAAQKKHQQGTQLVTFFLYPNGKISQLRYKKRLGFPSLDKNTLNVIRRSYRKYPRPKTKTQITFYVQYTLN